MVVSARRPSSSLPNVTVRYTLIHVDRSMLLLSRSLELLRLHLCLAGIGFPGIQAFKRAAKAPFQILTPDSCQQYDHNSASETWHHSYIIQWYSSLVVPLPPDVISLQRCTPGVVGVQLKLCTVKVKKKVKLSP
jgi:hypothetical protein